MPLHRILIIGAGSIGERHLRCFLSTGRAKVLLCEINDNLLGRIAEQYSIEQTFTRLDEALAEEFDAAVVCTPAHLHVPMAIQLAHRGAHLLIEKPLSTGMDGVRELQRCVQAGNLLAAVAYVWRAHPGLLSIRQAIQEKRFGGPVSLVVNSGQHFPTYRPAYREIYYADRAKGGGAVQDALTHLLNAGEWLAGPIQRLACDAGHQLLEGVTVEDTAHLLARQGRAMGCYTINQYQAPNEVTITVVCERGTLRLETHRERWGWMTAPEGDWHYKSLGPLARDTLFTTQANCFLDALEGHGAPLCGLEEGIQTLRVNLAALRAAETCDWQTVYKEDYDEV